MKRMIDDKIISKLSIKNDVLEIDGTVNADKITGDEIVETMTGYSVYDISDGDGTNLTITPIYLGIVKNGNKLTIVYNFILALVNKTGSRHVASIVLPSAIGSKLFADLNGVIAYQLAYGAKSSIQGDNTPMYIDKISNTIIKIAINDVGLTEGDTYNIRYEQTLLLSDNLVSQ